MFRRAAWVGMAVLASGIAVYAMLVLVVPGFGAPLVDGLRGTARWALAAHLAGSVIALGAGPWQLNAQLRNRAIGFHRLLGRAYVVGVLVGGAGGLILSPRSQEGVVTHVGFGLLAVCWLACTLMGYREIRRGDDLAHRAWMIRSFSLTLAAVTLRIYLPLELVAGLSFHDAYRIVSWLCWVPNLAVGEWFVRAGRAGSQTSLIAVV
jgi:uncharacterized membrane protein